MTCNINRPIGYRKGRWLKTHYLALARTLQEWQARQHVRVCIPRSSNTLVNRTSSMIQGLRSFRPAVQARRSSGFFRFSLLRSFYLTRRAGRMLFLICAMLTVKAVCRSLCAAAATMSIMNRFRTLRKLHCQKYIKSWPLDQPQGLQGSRLPALANDCPQGPQGISRATAYTGLKPC